MSSQCALLDPVNVKRRSAPQPDRRSRYRGDALGGHLDECTDCGYRPAISYNSCRDRHCPQCQANARDRWLQARRQELLPTRYVHVVFTLPHELAPLALQNKKILYHLLLQTSAETLLEVARDPKHLGAEIGFFSVLHTWNQKLELHPHAHCVAPAGGLSLDRTHWIQPCYPFFLPVKVLSRVFRGKFIAALQRNFRQGKLDFHGSLKPLAHPQAFSAWLRPLFRHDWHGGHRVNVEAQVAESQLFRVQQDIISSSLKTAKLSLIVGARTSKPAVTLSELEQAERTISDRRQQLLSTIARMNGAKAVTETHAKRRLFFGTLPAMAEEDLRDQDMLSPNAVDLLPLESPWRGTPRSPLFVLETPYRQLIPFSLFDPSLTDANMLMMAKSGGGKSFIVQLLLLMASRDNPQEGTSFPRNAIHETISNQ